MKSLGKSDRREVQDQVSDLMSEYGAESPEELGHLTGMNPLRLGAFFRPGRHLKISSAEELSLSLLRTYAVDLADEDPQYIQEFLSEKIDEAIKDSEEELDVSKRRLQIIQNIKENLLSIDHLRVAGHELNEVQKMAVAGFCDWLDQNISEKVLTGQMVAPTGTGKTYLSILLSKLVGGKTVFFTYSNNLAMQTCDAFNDHQDTLSEEEKGELGEFFGKNPKNANGESDFILSNFYSSEKIDEEIDWSEVNLILVDEADVVGLSDSRQEYLHNLVEKYGIPVVGLSATEKQASGKKLDDFYRSKILQLSMPDSLLRLVELGLVPKASFHDVYLDSTLTIDESTLRARRDIPLRSLQEFVQSEEWLKKILRHYLQNNMGRKGLVIFRDNKMVDDFLIEAESMGVKVKPFTGELSPDQLEQTKKELEQGKIDLLVGSKLLGRGLDIPELEVVYNSTITYSPQVFWQAGGRALRRSAQKEEVDIINLLPSQVTDVRTGDPFTARKMPLSHSIYFDPSYLNHEELRNEEYSVKLHDAKFLRTGNEVENILNEGVFRPKGYIGRILLISKVLSALTNPVYYQINTLRKINPIKLLKIYEHLTGENLLEEFEDYDFSKQLLKPEELELFFIYNSGRNSEDVELKIKSEEAFEKLLDFHLPLMEGMAEIFSRTDDEYEENLQIARICFYKILDDYNPDVKARITQLFLIRLYRELSLNTFTNGSDIKLSPRFVNLDTRLINLIFYKKYENNFHEGSPDKEQLLEWLYTLPFSQYIQHLSEFAEELGLDKKMLDSYAQLLSCEYEDVDNVEVEDELGDDVETRFMREEIQGNIRKTLATLIPREEKILRMKYGFDGESCTFREIGEYFDFTSSNVSRVLNRAFDKLRHPFRSHLLIQYLDDDFIDFIHKRKTGEESGAFVDYLYRLKHEPQNIDLKTYLILKKLRAFDDTSEVLKNVCCRLGLRGGGWYRGFDYLVFDISNGNVKTKDGTLITLRDFCEVALVVLGDSC
ncbi:sigma-70 family RNA polymerase sigma factor [Candidatus Peregrinibacteria bacterium]|nr:sigma-70 family RNA polymerase sigma factor [Candidatus Peregrinibacteria bacterium]